jgi:hypothetical protein
MALHFAQCSQSDGFFMQKVDSDLVTASCNNIPAAFPGNPDVPAVVEVGLLMPAHWAAALIELSKVREVSVAQILRASVAQTLREVGLAV